MPHDEGLRDHGAKSFAARVIVIAAYGESTMTGWGLPYGQDIPTFLQRLLPHTCVVNEGVPATTARQLLTGSDGKHMHPWRRQMQNSRASIIVLNRGINEPYNGESPADFKQALQELTITALHAGKTVVLQTPNPTITGTELDRGVAASARVIREVAHELQLPLSDAYSLVQRLLREKGGTSIPDGVHPTADVYQVMAIDLAQIITPLLASLQGPA
ncbi:SGNH/GDSL hydrolase family protein [Herbaspirillum sp. GCM10030257]|uniref:SGNH/GDSL hydrolase family protein n=1 Tax=Herbaspirillum sp. GCM10030257 TaxID=3273393 RepID=UPI003609FD80